MGRALTLFFGLLAFGLLAWFCLGHSAQIQKEVGANAKSALGAGGFDFARVNADGQTITLSGTAETEAMRTAAERAVLAAPGVIAVDNQIVLLTDVPPPGPDSGPVMVDEVPDTETADVASDTTDDGIGGESSDATDGGAMAAGAPANPIPESVEIILQNYPEDADSKRAEVVGLVLSPKLDSERQTQVGEKIADALPGFKIDSDLKATANESSDLFAAVEQFLPMLTDAETAQLDADEYGIRISAELATYKDRVKLAADLAGVKEKMDMGGRDLAWLLDSPPSNADSCQRKFNELLGKNAIMFTISKAEIRTRSLPLLDKLAAVASDCDATIAIEGHTDSRGTAELNDNLSQARADSVRDYLIDKGIDGDSISAKGFGSAKPIADNNTVNGRQANRRIEFRVERNQP